jgi:threonine-phosphate decarboxylase
VHRHTHGGNVKEVAAQLGWDAGRLIDFSVNLNPLGPPPQLADNLIAQAALTAYPEPYSRGMAEAGAAWLGVQPEQLIFANGAVELIYLLVQALAPEVALIPGPTFADYAEAVHINGGRVKQLRLSYLTGFCPTLRYLERAARGAGLVFLCNPNNPTGNLLPAELLWEFQEYCAAEKIFLVVDESFLPFHRRWRELSLIGRTAGCRHLLVLQSLTKIFAIPGLRVGCAVAHPDLVRRLAERQPPWQVNGIAQQLTPLCFRDDGYLERSRQYLDAERQWLEDALARLPGVRVFPSETAYILLQLQPSWSSARLAGSLAAHGLVVRQAGNFAFLDERYLRVAVKRREENQLLVNSLREILERPT